MPSSQSSMPAGSCHCRKGFSVAASEPFVLVRYTQAGQKRMQACNHFSLGVDASRASGRDVMLGALVPFNEQSEASAMRAQ
eukprot:11218420-Lingulodinium_polyedra.AAC.1